MYKSIKLTSTPREALSVSEFSELVEGLGYEAYDGIDESYEGGYIYTGNENRTVLVFWGFDSKRDAQS